MEEYTREHVNMVWKRNKNWNKDDLELGTWNLSILCVFSLRWISFKLHLPTFPTTPKHLSPSQTHFPSQIFFNRIQSTQQIPEVYPSADPKPNSTMPRPCWVSASRRDPSRRPCAGSLLLPAQWQRPAPRWSRAKSPRMRAGNTAATDWRWKASWFSQQ